ncbi:hypothetical protein ACFRJ3_08980 [Streptomyces sp. NPDC056696]|uniref:hypothetical protein n=1 Tax=Streptomyces sp. NPDC056696 TaxID=3345914 RepID=UPI0036B77B3B
MQTAVIGNASSDHPVILPMEVAELEVWRRRHPNYTYWCGYELGGCGGRLMDRLYHDKVCHFAHVAGGPTCGRAATGESSADHLFIKRGLRNLLREQGQRGDVRTHDLGSGPGGAVDLHLPATRRRLRFQLSPLDYRGWRSANLALGGDVDEVDWFFGWDGPLTEELLARNGYGLRFRLETVGGERRVHVGTRTYDEPSVRWDLLEDCRIERAGLLTPAAEALGVPAQRPEPFAFRLDGPVIFTLDKEAPVPDDSPFVAEGRRLVMADVKPLGSPAVRAVLSLPDDTAPPPAQYVYRAADRARLLVREGADGWALHLDRFVRLNAHEAARTGLAGMLPEPPERQSAAAPRTRQPSHQPPVAPMRDQPPAGDQKQRAKKGVTLTRDQAIRRVRKILRASAPRGRTHRWSALAAQLGEPLTHMSVNERIDFLVELDSPLWDTKAVLSVLLCDDAGLMPCLPAVLAKLGVRGVEGLSADSPALRSWVNQERERAIALYASPSRAVPRRQPVISPARELTAQQWREVGASTRRVQQHKPKQNRIKGRDSTAEERRQVRELLNRVEKRKSVLGGAFKESKQTRRTLRVARVWLTLATPGSPIPANRSPLEAEALRTSAAELLAKLHGIATALAATKAKYW